MKPFYRNSFGALSIGAALAAGVQADNYPVSTFEPVLVTATLSEVSERDAPAAVSIIGKEEIAQHSGQDISELLAQTTGVSLSGRGVGNRKVINLRGMESHHTLIMIDGRRISASDAVVGHSDFQNSWVSKESIERIEVVRGPLSSLYGSEGMGGVINIITKKPEQNWSGNIKLNGGTAKRAGQELDLTFGASGKLSDKLGLRLDAAVADHDKTELKNKPSMSEAESKESQALALSLHYQITDNHNFELYLNQIDELRARDTLSRSRVAHESTYDIERSMVSLAYNGALDTSQLSAKIYRSSIAIKNTASNGVKPTSPQELSDTVFEAHIIHQLGSKQLVTIGTEYREEELDHTMIAGGNDSLSNRALFVQDEVNLSDSLSLTFGARLDDHEIFGGESSPRAYLVYSMNPKWKIKSGYGEGFRAPTLKQISPNYRFAGFHTFIGNPELGPETSQTIELAVQYYGDNVKGGLTVFRNDIDNLIQTECVTNCSKRLGRVFKYVNVSEAQIQGAELDLSLSLARGLALSINASVLDAENKTTGIELSNRPELSANAKLNWRSRDGSWQTSLRGQYIGEQMDGRNTLPQYTLWNASVSKKLNSNTSVRVGVDNIGNTYLADKDPNFSFEERGRFVYLSTEFTF